MCQKPVFDPAALASPAIGKGPVRSARPKLWHQQGKLLCPIIGTCLTIAEQRDLARRADMPDIAALDDYELHTHFVGCCGQKNALSLAVQKLLERKFRSACRHFHVLHEEAAVQALWQDYLERGEVPAAFWALVTHPRQPDEAITRAYRELHMLAHQLGADKRAELKSLARQLDDAKRLNDSTRQQNQKLRRRLARYQADLDQLRATATRAQRLTIELNRARNRIATLEQRLPGQDSQRTIARQARQLQRQQRQIEQLQQQREQATPATAPEVATPGGTPPLPAPPSTDAPCEGTALDLQGRCILCVGGRATLLAHYRQAVEGCNGRFIHHDGGREQRSDRLSELLTRADAVICPADCVSHDAYNRCKRFCKRRPKPCIYLRSSGIQSFTNALGHVVQ